MRNNEPDNSTVPSEARLARNRNLSTNSSLILRLREDPKTQDNFLLGVGYMTYLGQLIVQLTSELEYPKNVIITQILTAIALLSLKTWKTRSNDEQT